MTLLKIMLLFIVVAIDVALISTSSNFAIQFLIMWASLLSMILGMIIGATEK